MAKVQKFEDLTIFQMARELCKEVYAITKEGEFHKDSGFVGPKFQGPSSKFKEMDSDLEPET